LDDPEFRPGTSSGSTGTTGSGGSDDPTTTDGVSGVVLEPKVAVKTIPSALGLVVARGSDPSGGQPSGVEVAAAETDGSARLAAAPSADGSEEAAGPVATSRTGLTRRLSDSIRLEPARWPADRRPGELRGGRLVLRLAAPRPPLTRPPGGPG
jgi:hypothetical protein